MRRAVLVALSLGTTLRGQSTIRGSVVDARTGRALPYSAVAVGSTERFTTDSGRFVFTNVDAKRVQLRVRHVGYIPLDTTFSFDAAPPLELRPIAGAEVRDPRSGSSAKTTATGTVSLAFVLSSPVSVLLRADGYEPMSVGVKLSFADTMPMAVLLRRKVP